MLAAIGVETLDQLFDQVPPSVRFRGGLQIPDGISEMEMVADLRRLASLNRSADDLVCFAGAGAYDHYVPSVVWALAGRSEFYTSYTPVSARALAGGAAGPLRVPVDDLCAHRPGGLQRVALRRAHGARGGRAHDLRPGRRRVLVSDGLDPRYVEALKTFGRGAGYEPEPFTGDPEVGSDVAAVVVQHPNVYGELEPAAERFAAAAAGGAKAIQVFDPSPWGCWPRLRTSVPISPLRRVRGWATT